MENATGNHSIKIKISGVNMIAHFLNGQDIFLIMHVNVVAINLSMYLYINMELKSFFPPDI